MLTGGYLERLLGARWGAAFGSVIYTGSLALSYFSIQESYFLLIVTMGLFASFGIGVTYNCVLIQCQKAGIFKYNFIEYQRGPAGFKNGILKLEET